MIETDDAAASLYPSMKPSATPDDWRIDLKYLPVGYHGRSFLALVDPDGMTVNELHGLRDAKDAYDASGPAARLSVAHDTIDDTNPPRFDDKKDAVSHIATIASGSENEMARLWSLGRQAGTAIDQRALDHDAYDKPDGGGANHVHVGNAVTYTLAKAMGLDVPGAIEAIGMPQKFPGHDRDLLEGDDDKNIVRVKGPAKEVEVAQQRAPQQRQPAPASPQPPKDDPITPVTESRREAALDQVHLKERREDRQRQWDDMVRQLPVQTPPGSKFQAPLPHDWRSAINKIDPRYLKFTENAAAKHGIPPELLARLLYRESNYTNANAGREDKAQGIPQMYDKALESIGLDYKSFHTIGPERQIDAGAKYLAQQYKQFGNWPQAVAAYHSGPGRMSDWFAGRGRDFDSVAGRMATYVPEGTTAAKKESNRQDAARNAGNRVEEWRELRSYLPYIFLGDPQRYDQPR